MMRNFSNTSSSVNPAECAIYEFLGGALDQTTKEAYSVLFFLIVTCSLVCPVTVGLNLLVMIAVKTKPRLKTNSNIALGCLALTDCFMGGLGLPIFITARIFTLQGATSSSFCFLTRSSRNVLRILGGVTVLHLLLMNVERYLAIKHSFRYPCLVTGTRILQSSAFLWFIALLATLPLVILDEDIYLTVNNIILIICLAIIAFCQVTVYLETRRHRKKIAAHQVSEEIRRKFLKEKKAFKLTTVVLLIQLITYAPIFVVRICLTNSVIRSKNEAYIAFFTATFVLILSSMINPIIYCVWTKKFRGAFSEILRFRTKRNAQAEEASFTLSSSLRWKDSIDLREERTEIA